MTFLAIHILCVSFTAPEICDDHTTVEGQETSLHCQCTGSSTAAATSNDTCQGTYIVWYVDDYPIGSCSNGDVMMNDQYHWTMTINADEQLVIFAAYTNNTGQYTCEKYQTGSFVTYLEVQGRSGRLLSSTRTVNVTQRSLNFLCTFLILINLVYAERSK